MKVLQGVQCLFLSSRLTTWPSRSITTLATIKRSLLLGIRPSVGTEGSRLLRSVSTPLLSFAQSGESGALNQRAAIPPGSTAEEVVKRVGKEDVQISFARSGGAGGQNVNKVNTKVDMRLNLEADWLIEDMRNALQRLVTVIQERKRINKDGELVLTSQKTRSQADNVEDALEKIQACLDRAAESIIPAKPDPAKAKEIAKRKNIANENRIQQKKMKADKKSQRRSKIEW